MVTVRVGTEAFALQAIGALLGSRWVYNADIVTCMKTDWVKHSKWSLRR